MDLRALEEARATALEQNKETLFKRITEVSDSYEAIGFKFPKAFSQNTAYTHATMYGHLNNRMVELEVMVTGGHTLTYVKKS
jgi:hypothetical protein